MKTLLRILVALGVLVIALQAQAINYYNTTSATVINGTSSWTTSATGIGGSNPANLTTAGDVFIIRAGSELTTNANLTVRSLTISEGAKLTVAHRCTLQTTLTVNGHLVYNVAAGWFTNNIFSASESFGSNSTFEILDGDNDVLPALTNWGSIIFRDNSFSGAWNLDIANNATINGNIIVESTDTDRVRLAANSCTALTLVGNLDLRDGTIRFGNNTSRALTIRGSVIMSGSAEFEVNNSTQDLTFIFDDTDCAWNVTNTTYDRDNVAIRVNSGATLTLNSQLNMGNGEIFELAANSNLVMGSFQVRGDYGTTELVVGAGATISTSHPYGLTGDEFTFGAFGMEGPDCTFSPTFNVVITGSSDVYLGTYEIPYTSSRISMGTLTVNLTGGAELYVDDNLTLNGNVTISSGAVLYLPSFATLRRGTGGTFTLNGQLEQLNSGGSFGASGAAVEGYTAGQITLGSGSTVLYSSSSAQVVSSLVPFQNLTLSGLGARSTTGTVTVQGAFIHNGGTLNISDDRLELNGTLSGTGTLSDNASSEVRIGGSGAAATWSFAGELAGTFNIQRASGVALGTNLTVNGTLALTSGGLTIGSRTLTIGGNVTGTNNLQGSSSSTLVIGGTSSNTMSAFGRPSSLGTLTLSPTSARTYAIGTSLTVNTGISLNANATLDLGANSLALVGTTFSLNAASVITGSTGAVFSAQGSGAELVLPSTFSLPSGVLFRVNKSTSGVALGGSTTLNALQLTAGYLAIGANTLTLQGVLSGTSGLLRGGANSNLTISGSGTNLYNLTFDQSGSFANIRNLTINRTGQDITLGNNLTIAANGTATLTAGNLLTDVYKLTLSSTAAVAGEDLGHRILGTVETTRAVGTGASTFGNLGYEILAGAENLGSVVCTRRTGPGMAVSGNGSSSINCVFDVVISGTQPSSGRRINLEWLSADDNGKNFLARPATVFRRETPASPLVKLRLGNEFNMVQVAGNRRKIFSQTYHFSEYTVSTDNSTLPVTLSSFTGEATTEGNELHWTTSQEVNNAGFTLQRSLDGNVFTDLTFVKGRGTVSNTSQYQYLDTQAPELAYYRLIQEDLDGTKEVFKTITVRRANQVEKVRPVMTLWPNPATTELNLSVTGAPASYKLAVWDATGREMHTAASIAEKLNVSAWPSGLYTVQLISTDGTETRKTFVKP